MNDELPPDLANLYAREQTSAGPSPDERRALRASLGATLGIATVSGTAAAGSASAAGVSAGSAASVGLAAKVTLAVLLVAGAGGGGYVWSRHSPSAATLPKAPLSVATLPPIETATPPLPAEQPTEAAALESSPEQPPARRDVPPVDRKSVAPPPPSRDDESSQTPLDASSTDGEDAPTVIDGAPAVVDTQAAMLSRAWSLLDQGNPSEALSIADADAAAHPDGVLVEERDALRIDALAKLQRLREAKIAARAFLAAFPNSIHRPTVERVLEP